MQRVRAVNLASASTSFKTPPPARSPFRLSLHSPYTRCTVCQSPRLFLLTPLFINNSMSYGGYGELLRVHPTSSSLPADPVPLSDRRWWRWLRWWRFVLRRWSGWLRRWLWRWRRRLRCVLGQSAASREGPPSDAIGNGHADTLALPYRWWWLRWWRVRRRWRRLRWRWWRLRRRRWRPE